MSSPRAATSVAMSTGDFPDLNSFNVHSRSCCVLSPWIDPTLRHPASRQRVSQSRSQTAGRAASLFGSAANTTRAPAVRRGCAGGSGRYRPTYATSRARLLTRSRRSHATARRRFQKLAATPASSGIFGQSGGPGGR
eukprot:1181305-Prorocentrum_minimum.AAC.3